MQKFQLTTVDIILSKFQRDIGDENIEEDTIIEWIGEALGFLSYRGVLEEAVLFAEVKNHQIDLPTGYKYILDVAKNRSSTYLSPCDLIEERGEAYTTEALSYSSPCPELSRPLCCGSSLFEEQEFLLPNMNKSVLELPRMYVNMYWRYAFWYNSPVYTRQFEPVKLANNTFFNSVVCPDSVKPYRQCYENYEYTIINGALRFSFKEGQVAVSYLKIPIDDETGYPLIPDDISFITAITYYVKWKLAENYSWNGREGFSTEADKAEVRWNKYVMQAKIKNKKLVTKDDWDRIINSHNERNFFRTS